MLTMNYKKIYKSIIIRAKTRPLIEGYSERHHIIPRCMSGSDDEKNIAILTPEEHFICHQLLVKMQPNNLKLAFAANMMCVDKGDGCRNNNKRFGWLKRKLSLLQKGNKLTEEAKILRKSRMIQKGTSRKGKPGNKLTEETKQKLSRVSHRKGKPGRRHTDETKQKLSRAAKGRVSHRKGKPGRRHTDVSRKNISESMRKAHAAKRGAV